MAKLKWDKTSEHFYETGVSHGVFFPWVPEHEETGTVVPGAYGKGEVWNGLTSVNMSSEGGEPTAIWADDMKYLNLISAEDITGTIEAYTYPDGFAEADGSAEILSGLVAKQQKRKPFGFSFETVLGNDTDGDSFGRKIHLIYNCLASPTDRDYQTINDSPEAITFSWEISTTPVEVGEGYKPTAELIIDTTKVDEDALADFLDVLYGKDPVGQTAGTDARLPLPAEVITLLTP